MHLCPTFWHLCQGCVPLVQTLILYPGTFSGGMFACTSASQHHDGHWFSANSQLALQEKPYLGDQSTYCQVEREQMELAV